jgi:E-phenylitaconyl-CoA hydratase
VSIGYEINEHVATIRLDRPHAMNAIDPQMRVDLRRAFRDAHADANVRVVVLTGAGEKAFCTGSDLKNTQPPAESFAELTFGRSESDHLLEGLDTDKPLIAAINGYAFGGGLELALACDIRLCSPNAQFGLTEVRIGSIPGAGGTQNLARAIGLSNAMRLLLTGDRIDAEEALRIGIVSQVVPHPSLADAAQEIAARVAANAPLAVRAAKRLARDGMDLPMPQALRLERYVFGLLRDTEDRLEGRAAFREKRPAAFKGR